MEFFDDNGYRLQRIRKLRGLKQSDLAKGETYTAASVSNWEINGTLPHGDRLEIVAEKLGVSTMFLGNGIPWVQADMDVLAALKLPLPPEQDPREVLKVAKESGDSKAVALVDEKAAYGDGLSSLMTRMKQAETRKFERGEKGKLSADDLMALLGPWIRELESNPKVLAYMYPVLEDVLDPLILEKLMPRKPPPIVADD